MILQFLIIIFLIIALFMLATAYGERNVTLSIEPGEIWWCIYGHRVVYCDMEQRNNITFNEISIIWEELMK